MPSVDDISNRILVDEKATVAFGGELHDAIRRLCGESAVVYLHGDLGAGKTTLVRGILRLMNHSGAVKSPTYTLLEPYQTDRGEVFHFDLYRLKSPEELEFLGFDEIFDGPGFKFVEWPGQGAGWLPPANVEVSLSLHAPSQTSEEPVDLVAQMQRKVSVRFA
jgi:tRNA threonylcarbamoyladenosine biosynthesis protein TsaE